MKSKGIFFNIPGYGHVNPTLPMIKELIERGEDIDYCCTEEFRPMIERTGATFVPLPQDVVYPTQEGFTMLKIFGDLMEEAYQMLPAVELLLIEGEYDYVLADMYTPWGRLLAQKLNLPLMVFFPSFALHPKMKEPIQSKLQIFNNLWSSLEGGWRLGKYLKKMHQSSGLLPVSFLTFINKELDIPCVTFTAKEFQPQGELFPDNYFFTGPNINTSVRLSDGNFPMERLEGKKVIYISLGSVVVSRVFIQTCIQAFANTEYVVVLNISKLYAKEEFEATPNIILCNFAPQLEILPKADLFITHGGMNSTHEGLYFEVPLLVVPQGGDQFLVAQKVVEKQLGKRLSSKRLSPAKLRQTVEAIMRDKTIQEEVKKMSQALKNAGGYKEAANRVQQFIGAIKKKEGMPTV